MSKMTRRDILGVGLASLLVPKLGRAQTVWPSRPVRFVVPFSPGGGGDTAARTVASKAADILGQQIIVENRSGGNTLIAANVVLQAGDGHTFFWDGNNHLSNPVLVKDLPFDYAKAFVPVAHTARFPQVLAVRQDFPARTLDEFIDYVRANPGKVSCGTPPSGGMGHLALQLFKLTAKLDIMHTPYKGGADAVRDIMGAHVDAVLLTTSTIRPPLLAGKARLLAITSAQRSPLYPEVPTFAERFPNFDMDDWNGLFAPAGTPNTVIVRLNAAVAQAAREPALVAKIAPLGTVLVSSTPEEFTAWLTRQREVVQKVIKQANITLS